MLALGALLRIYTHIEGKDRNQLGMQARVINQESKIPKYIYLKSQDKDILSLNQFISKSSKHITNPHTHRRIEIGVQY